MSYLGKRSALFGEQVEYLGEKAASLREKCRILRRQGAWGEEIAYAWSTEVCGGEHVVFRGEKWHVGAEPSKCLETRWHFGVEMPFGLETCQPPSAFWTSKVPFLPRSLCRQAHPYPPTPPVPFSPLNIILSPTEQHLRSAIAEGRGVAFCPTGLQNDAIFCPKYNVPTFLPKIWLFLACQNTTLLQGVGDCIRKCHLISRE